MLKMPRRCLALLITTAAALAGCGSDVEVSDLSDGEVLSTSGVNADQSTVSTMIDGTCSTVSVKGLSTQLIEEINCLEPGTMAPIPQRSNLSMGAAVFPYLQQGAAAALGRALDQRGSTMYINSALRTLPQQYLLHQWYLRGRCGIALAASPGTSNHESGLAVDMSNYNTWRPTLSASSFAWFGGGDPVHFDYTGPRKDIRSLSVLAFQRLWNRNNPNDRIGEDGVYGDQTALRIERAPAIGFEQGASCADTLTPTAQMTAIEVYWYRNPDGSYKLRALAPSSVDAVEYLVDGYTIGAATRADGANFPSEYTFSTEAREREFEVRGYAADGDQIGLGVGLIDVTPDYGVYIRQLGDNLYAVGVERAPQGVAYIEVDADTYPVGDSIDEDRLEVRHNYNTLGVRDFTLRTYNADGTLRGTLRRSFELR